MLTHQNAPDQQKAKAVSLLLKLKLWASSSSMLVVQWYWYTVVYLQRISLNSVNRRRVQSMLYNRSAGHSYLCCWWLISQPWKIKLIHNIQMKTSVKNTKGVHCSHSLYCSHCIFDVSWFLFFAFSCVSRSCWTQDYTKAHSLWVKTPLYGNPHANGYIGRTVF